MNILFIDKDKELEAIFHHIEKVVGFHVDFCHDCESGIDFFKKAKYDIIIINFSLDSGDELLEEILKSDPKQRIITVSDALTGSELKGGEYCQRHYNKRRLIKPIDVKELIGLIKNFDESVCKYMGKFDCKEGLIDIMSDIIKRYPQVEYNKKEHLIYSENIKYTLDIVDMLTKEDISYTLKNEHTIKI